MTSPDETQPFLDGVDLGEERTRGRMRAAVVATIEALKSEALLEPRHAGMVQLALELADSIDFAASSSKTKAYAVALVAGQLRDTLQALPAPATAELNAQFERALAAYLSEQ